MDIVLDLTKEYGLVLEGGGAKGAYQIGAWKALKEAGVKIKGVSGVSVGALNGALICMGDIDRALDIWENITYSQVMDVQDDLMEEVMKGSFENYNIADVMKEGIRILLDGGMDITPLRNLIDQVVDEQKIRNSAVDLYVITYSVSDHMLLDIDIKDAPVGLIGDMLLASAYFLAFKNKKLHGKKYMDGGGWNNVPLDALIDRGYKDIIIFRIYGLGVDTERKIEVPEDVGIYHVAPRQRLGHILEFDGKKSRKHMNMGYFDAMRMLYGLCGKWYYVNSPKEESYYFCKMVALAAFDWSDTLETYQMDNKDGLKGCRIFTELVIPKIVKLLGLKKDWGYKELYLRILEEAAKELRINRFKLFTDNELLLEIQKKFEILKEDGKLPSVYIEIANKCSAFQLSESD